MITVANKSPNPQGLYFFQEPAKYSGGQEVYTNSLAFQNIAGYQGGVIAQVIFSMGTQYYAGVQTQTSPPGVSRIQTSAIVAAEIDLTNPGGETDNMTAMSIANNTLGLSPASYDTDVTEGAFRVVTPAWNPNLVNYNVGLAGLLGNGRVILSNFITAPPSSNVDVSPTVILYVSIGNYTGGMTIDFPSSSKNAAVCDTTTGVTDFMVTYEVDGTWTVQRMTRAILRRQARINPV
jgi:hypothetical protein